MTSVFHDGSSDCPTNAAYLPILASSAPPARGAAVAGPWCRSRGRPTDESALSQTIGQGARGDAIGLAGSFETARTSVLPAHGMFIEMAGCEVDKMLELWPAVPMPRKDERRCRRHAEYPSEPESVYTILHAGDVGAAYLRQFSRNGESPWSSRLQLGSGSSPEAGTGRIEAEVAELADALRSGRSGGNLVGVQISPSAPQTPRGDG